MNKKFFTNLMLVFVAVCSLSMGAIAQMDTLPEPGPPRNSSIPKPAEKTLPNGLRVIVVQTKNVPIVTASMTVKSGGEADPGNLSGLADFAASLMTKGTKTRSATKIAEEIEFLGGFIGAGAGWDQSSVSTRVTNDKIDKAMAVLSDVVMNPAFTQEEIDRYSAQLLDDLAVRMKQPGQIANYVSSKIVFNNTTYSHPISGTPESVKRIKRDDIAKFYSENYVPGNSVLVFTGDILPATAFTLATKWFGKWKNPPAKTMGMVSRNPPFIDPPSDKKQKVKGITVIDLPNSGQAAVNFSKVSLTRNDPDYYKASVLNSLLGGGYSSRLNQEVRIKRGLSYGAGSNFSMRRDSGMFRMSCQTKNESAGEVAELFVTELEKLAKSDITSAELTPRKSVLTGNFGRDLATTFGLAGIVSNLAVYGLPLSQINSTIQNINAVSSNDVKTFATQKLTPNDGVIVIVGDYKLFSDDLKKRFEGIPVNVIPADKLDLESPDMMKK